MLRFEGDKDFSHPPEVVWAKLTDAGFLVRCIPDVDAVKEQSADRAALTIRPGFAFVRGTREVTLQAAGKAAPPTGLWLVRSKGSGSAANVEAARTLAPAGAGTRQRQRRLDVRR